MFIIKKGYTTFYDGGYGSFDKKCVDTILKLRTKYPHIKLIKIHAYYHHDKDRFVLPDYYNDSIYTDIENYHFKQVITKRNEWIVDHCDILVCHIEETYKSGAYNTVKYARKINKPIIYL